VSSTVAKLGHERPQLLARSRIEPSGRLVEEHDRRAPDQPGGEIESPAHASRVGAGAAVGGLGEGEALEQFIGAASGGDPGQPAQPAHHLEVLAPGQLLVDGRELAGEADPAADRERRGDDVVPEHGCVAAGRRLQRREDPDQRRLAGAVGSEQAEHGSGRYLEVEPVERDHVPEPHPQPVRLDRGTVRSIDRCRRHRHRRSLRPR
jgi:hypothetical protein